MKKKKEENHSTHPVRNFFYTLWSVLNLAAFVALFYALGNEALSFRIPLLLSAGAVLALALVFGFFKPLFAARER